MVRKYYKRKKPERPYTRQGIERTATARKCRRCGKDPAPNRFYCPSCHGPASDAYFME